MHIKPDLQVFWGKNTHVSVHRVIPGQFWVQSYGNPVFVSIVLLICMENEHVVKSCNFITEHDRCELSCMEKAEYSKPLLVFSACQYALWSS